MSHRFPRCGARWLALCLVSIAPVTPLLAADLVADAHIDHVTVYRQGAVVTRVAELLFPAGEHRLVFRSLPADLDANMLQVTAGSAGLQLGGIEIARINEANYVSEPERELRRRIEEVTDQQQVLKDEIATAQNQIKLLDSLAAAPAGGPNKGGIDAASLAAVLGTMASGDTAARKRIRDANLQLRHVDRQLEQLRADLAKVATSTRQSTEVRASVLANAAVNASVAVTYKVDNAAWEWIYQARLDSTRKHLVLERQGSVSQSSGEDWRNVELTLTTALPAEDLETPSLSSRFVDLRAPVTVNGLVARAGAAFLPAPAPAGKADLQEVIVTGAKRQNANASSTDYIADYRVPSRVSLLSDRQPRLFPIGESAFEVGLVARVVPSADHQAHLEAVFRYQDPLPIEAGQLQLYRDGAYVGAADTAAFLPGADVRIPFGIDERIRVAVRDEATQSGQKGLLGRQSVSETRQRIDITNYHPAAIPIEVLDRIPVPRNSDIRVEVLKGATEPSVKDVDGKAGVWLWKLEPAPQQTVTIHQAFSVEYPAGRQLQESDAPATP